VVVHLQVAEDSRRFEGHFRQDPLLPALSQLADFILPTARAHFGGGALRELSRVKWTQPLRPGTRFDLHLEEKGRGPEGTKLRFEIRVDSEGESKIACSGNLTLGPEGS
jgi:3-hydroxymyristoyl/3-hydroxydecanoyl-(acyl carrier protein) dehydratase